MRRTVTILILAAAVAVAAAGCADAGGDQGTPAAGPATTGGSAGADGGRDAYGGRSEPTSSRSSGSGDADTDDVRIEGFAFSPTTISAKVGQRIKWENQDVGVTHTVTADGGGFRSRRLPQGGEFSHLFQTAGTYPYRCAIHDDMRGTVKVGG